MFGPRLSRIFASRWMALWWAAMVLLLTWQLVPSAGKEDGGAAGSAAKTASAPVNPWALDPPKDERAQH